MDYKEFLKNKQVKIAKTGFDVEDDSLNPLLFDFQKYCVRKALKAGRFALFENCGLGKTIQQLEWSLQVSRHISKPVLILAPLSVVPQTINEGSKFGYTVNEIEDGKVISGIYITNYDNLPDVVVFTQARLSDHYVGSNSVEFLLDLKNQATKHSLSQNFFTHNDVGNSIYWDKTWNIQNGQYYLQNNYKDNKF